MKVAGLAPKVKVSELDERDYEEVEVEGLAAGAKVTELDERGMNK